MLIRNQFVDGKKHITSENDATNMLMDIDVYQMKKGESLEFIDENKETAILLMVGGAEFLSEGKAYGAERDDCLAPNAACIHVCKGVKVVVTATRGSEIFVQKTTNENNFATVFYHGDNIRSKITGVTTWDGMAKRQVVTIIDDDNAPYSNLVIGEVVSFGGRWSSYTPHSHPQPEVYYYKFAREGGFGAGFVGDNAFKTEDGTALCIKGGNTHPQASAPGYDMYYVWAIRHLDGDRWRNTRVEDKRYAWLNGEKL